MAKRTVESLIDEINAIMEDEDARNHFDCIMSGDILTYSVCIIASGDGTYQASVSDGGRNSSHVSPGLLVEGTTMFKALVKLKNAVKKEYLKCEACGK